MPELAKRKVLKSIDAPLDAVVPAKRAITLRDLLNMTFGLGCRHGISAQISCPDGDD